MDLELLFKDLSLFRDIQIQIQIHENMLNPNPGTLYLQNFQKVSVTCLLYEKCLFAKYFLKIYKDVVEMPFLLEIRRFHTVNGNDDCKITSQNLKKDILSCRIKINHTISFKK